MASGKKGKEGAEAEEAAAAGKGSRKRGKGSERAPAAKRKPGTIGRPKGSRNKPETPGKVVAVGLDVPRLDGLKAAAEAQKAAEDEVKGEKPDGYEFGRPTSYRPEYAAIARAMCRLGASDADLAAQFNVKTQTIWLWRCKNVDFFDALTDGKDAFDDRIERSLAQRAAGFSVHTEKLFNYEGTVIRAETVEFYPPDVGAIKLWLGNRRPDKWKDKQELRVDGTDCFLKLWQAISDGTIQ